MLSIHQANVHERFFLSPALETTSVTITSVGRSFGGEDVGAGRVAEGVQIVTIMALVEVEICTSLNLVRATYLTFSPRCDFTHWYFTHGARSVLLWLRWRWCLSVVPPRVSRLDVKMWMSCMFSVSFTFFFFFGVCFWRSLGVMDTDVLEFQVLAFYCKNSNLSKQITGVRVIL